MDRLGRAYRRLMHVYPAWYRRDRGLEILTTLLDDAAPGQHRPRFADVAGLISGGLRARARPPRSLVAWPVTIMVSLSVAVAAASAAVLVSGYPGPPTEEEAIVAATIAVGPPTYNVPGPVLHCPCAYQGGHDQVVRTDEEPMRYDNTFVYYAVSEVERNSVRARQRLVAAGWSVSAQQAADNPDYIASSDDLDLWVSTWPLPAVPNERAANLTVIVHKRVSASTVWGVAAAAIAGLITGWLIGVWALHRYYHHSLRRRGFIRIAARPFFGIAALILQATGLFIVVDFADGIDQADVQAPLAVSGLSAVSARLSVAGVLLGLVALLLTALRGTAADEARQPAGMVGRRRIERERLG